jgi:S1-C subfamily serine protease
VVAENTVLTTAAIEDDQAAVRAGNGQTAEGAVLGRISHMGLTVVRVDGLGLLPLAPADEPKAGHLAVAVGRTWSGGVMAAFAPIAVVGGPLRTGRASAIDRVIRIQHAPHGALNGGVLLGFGSPSSSAPSVAALGIITSMAIRGTTVVIPASLAWAAATKASTDGGTRQGFLGVSSMAVPIPERQRAGRAQAVGLLISQISPHSPADIAGLMVGDVLVAFDGQPIEEADELVTRLRGSGVGKTVPVTVLRGAAAVDVSVTVGERPSTARP